MGSCSDKYRAMHDYQKGTITREELFDIFAEIDYPGFPYFEAFIMIILLLIACLFVVIS